MTSNAPENSEDWFQPVVLENEWVTLRPLSLDDVPDLARAAEDTEIWKWMPVLAPRDLGEVDAIVRAALEEQRLRARLPFAVVHSGAAVGSTSYLDLLPEHRQLEIGWTWYAKSVQRSAVNTACKALLLGHAFETLNAHRVTFKTDSMNAASNAAILRIGGTYEGTLRAHRIRPDGGRRDSNYYSILLEEWDEVRQRLDQMLRADR